MCAAAATTINRRIVLVRRPQGPPVPEDFRLETHPVPRAGPGEVLLRTRNLSLDPYMRGRMNEGPSYAPPVALDAVMTGQTVSVVEASSLPAFRVGELVVANVGWQDYGISDHEACDAGGFHDAHGLTGHHRADGDRRGVGRRVVHAAAHVRVEREVARA